MSDEITLRKFYKMNEIDEFTNNDQDFSEWLQSKDGGGCFDSKAIGNDLYAAIKPLLFHWILIAGEIGDKDGYIDRWCYANKEKAQAALDAWDGINEPNGWHCHPTTGRRRTDGDPNKEYIAP